MGLKIDRKGFLLLLLYYKGEVPEPIRGRTRLAKLLFLLKEEKWGKNKLAKIAQDYYTFEPDNFGPFDINVYNDIEFFRAINFIEIKNIGPLPGNEADDYLRALKEWSLDNDLIEDIYVLDEKYYEQEFQLTKIGQQYVEEKILPKMTDNLQFEAIQFVRRNYGRWSLNKLLRYIYTKYPNMITKSKIKKKILGD